MKRALIVLLAGGICASSVRSAQQKDDATDRAAIEALGKRWQETWNRHDMDALSMLAAEDVDFITVAGPKGWLKGRTQLRDDHAAKHKTRFKDSVWTTKEMHIRFLRPDLAVAHVLWSTTGDRVPHIKHGEKREGIFMWVVEKRGGQWLIVASQNTESMPALPGQ